MESTMRRHSQNNRPYDGVSGWSWKKAAAQPPSRPHDPAVQKKGDDAQAPASKGALLVSAPGRAEPLLLGSRSPRLAARAIIQQHDAGGSTGGRLGAAAKQPVAQPRQGGRRQRHKAALKAPESGSPG